jgi:hypothetical protein
MPFYAPHNRIPPPDARVLDYQTMRDRLGSIVRSKEGFVHCRLSNSSAPDPYSLDVVKW